MLVWQLICFTEYHCVEFVTEACCYLNPQDCTIMTPGRGGRGGGLGEQFRGVSCGDEPW